MYNVYRYLIFTLIVSLFVFKLGSNFAVILIVHGNPLNCLTFLMFYNIYVSTLYMIPICIIHTICQRNYIHNWEYNIFYVGTSDFDFTIYFFKFHLPT